VGKKDMGKEKSLNVYNALLIIAVIGLSAVSLAVMITNLFIK